MKHPFDHKMGIPSDIAIWHADANMEALVVDIVEHAKPTCFVETGTHMGWTSNWMGTRFPDLDIFTVELMEDYYRLSGENLEGLPRVHRTLGDSRPWLRKMLPVFQQHPPPLFWLDAHFHADHPLREECSIVAAFDKPFLCLIDDYFCGADFPGDGAEIPMVESTLGVDYYRPNYPFQKSCSGYILFVRGVDYEPPAHLMRRNVTR